MAIIQSGASADNLTVDATSKAARVTLYDSAGNKTNPEYAGSYMTRIEVIPTTLTAATTYFAVRNLGARRVFIRCIELKLGFSGIVAASRSLYEFTRFSAATPTGGTALSALKKDNTMPATTLTDMRFAAGGLTVSGVVFESPLHLVGHTNQLSTDHAQNINFIGDGETGKFVIGVNEGFAIRANTAVVLGSYLIGSLIWDERT